MSSNTPLTTSTPTTTTTTTTTHTDSPRHSSDHPPAYHAARPPAYAPPTSTAPASARFAKHDQALTELYGRLEEEQAAVAAADEAAWAYEREMLDRVRRGEAPPDLHSQAGKDPREADGKQNVLERWNRWSAKFYAPNLYKKDK